jgi:4-diphosphocytidyl-2C-methyl-D-erythritol kinase
LNDQPQFATGRGEQLSPIELNLAAYEIRFIIPNIHVTTKTAF